MIIKYVEELSIEQHELIGFEFDELARSNQIAVNYEPFNFVAEENNNIIGFLTGYAYYNEIHIGDIILLQQARKKGIGTKLLQRVEEHFKGSSYEFITLTTYKFQALDFYLKNGYEIEYTRENRTKPELTRYFLKKNL